MSLVEYELVNCRECEEEYKRSLKKRPGRPLPIGVRGFNTKCCSNKCSRKRYYKPQKLRG